MADTDPADPNRPFDAALVGGDLSRGEAAVEAAGGRVVARLRWGEALGALETGPVLVVEAEGADEALLAGALPEVAQAADAFRLAVVAAFDRLSIDVVAANLWGPRVELLVEPDLPERAAALADAAEMGDLADAPAAVREGDAAAGFLPEAREPEDAEADAAAIRRAIRARRLRSAFFAPELFADPAWDMLLDLYAAELEGAPVSVSSLCIAAAVANTTALRWIARMVEEGLFLRQPDPGDRRRAFMTLTPTARAGMRAYMDGVGRGGLVPG